MTKEDKAAREAEVLANFRENLAKQPFNSDRMYQVPFDFFRDEDDSYLRLDQRDLDRKVFAKKYYEMQCGWLHLGWDIDAYWTTVANKVMIPYINAIYDALVTKGHTEENPCMYGDADGDIYWVPAKDPKTKVVVHTNQCRDYLYILTEYPSWKKGAPPNYDFHIRRIWRTWESVSKHGRDDLDDLYAEVTNDPERPLRQGNTEHKQMSKEEFIETVLSSLPSYEGIADDHYKYTNRPSIEYYRKRGFNMNGDASFNGIYGDMRDRGFVFSMQGRGWGGRAEYTAEKFNLLDTITTCYLPSVARDLEVELNLEWDKKNK